ncbi:MAG: MBL fold metallo-hydrolase [Clostridium sp.]|nr:MBL fold metallo-hydrolase [Clostridium sp.]
MYELEQVGEKSYYVNCPAKIGIYVKERKDAYLIDSGNDKDAGKKVRQILERQGWQLQAIFNTHSNADHIGGNRYLQTQTGCRVYAPGIDCAFTRHPVLEPAFLYGGYPPEALRHKFLMAQESDAAYLEDAVLPEGMQMIPLPGHFFDMVGFRTDDDVVYLADCLMSEESLKKYGIGFVYDVAAYLNTLEKVKEMKAAAFVPAHAPATDAIAPLAQQNIAKVQEIAETIETFLKEPMMFEQLLQRLFDRYGLTMNFEQYALVGSTVRSYLSYLADAGRIRACFDANRLLWARV